MSLKAKGMTAMSDAGNNNFLGDSDKLLPFPKRVAITTVADGSYSKNVPTIFLSYIGLPDDTLDFDILDRLDGISVDIMDETTLAMCLFLPNLIEEDFKFAEMHSINLITDKSTIDAFKKDLERIKKFAVVFSMNEYEVKYLVDHASAQIMEDAWIDRLLH